MPRPVYFPPPILYNVCAMTVKTLFADYVAFFRYGSVLLLMVLGVVVFLLVGGAFILLGQALAGLGGGFFCAAIVTLAALLLGRRISAA